MKREIGREITEIWGADVLSDIGGSPSGGATCEQRRNNTLAGMRSVQHERGHRVPNAGVIVVLT